MTVSLALWRFQLCLFFPQVAPEEAKEAEAKFVEINKAYEILGDKEKRAQYDKYGEQAFDGTGQAKHQGGGFGGFGGFEFHSSDFFDSFFEDHFRSHNFNHAKHQEQHRKQHNHHHSAGFAGGDPFDGFFDGFGDSMGGFESFSFSSGGGGMGQNCKTETIIRGNSRSTTTVCS